MADCLFCRIVQGEIPAKKIYEDDVAVAFNDINPQAPTHVLIIPKKHIVGLKEAEAADSENPRLLWQLGSNRWYLPPERGGGQSKAFETYEKGLASARNWRPTSPRKPADS